MTIVKDTAGSLYAVRETGDANLQHVWHAIPMKRVAGGFAPKGVGTMRLIRKLGCVVVREG